MISCKYICFLKGDPLQLRFHFTRNHGIPYGAFHMRHCPRRRFICIWVSFHSHLALSSLNIKASFFTKALSRFTSLCNCCCCCFCLCSTTEPLPLQIAFRLRKVRFDHWFCDLCVSPDILDEFLCLHAVFGYWIRKLLLCFLDQNSFDFICSCWCGSTS